MASAPWARHFSKPMGQPVRAGGLLYTGGAVLVAATGAIAATLAGSQVVTGGTYAPFSTRCCFRSRPDFLSP
jgi:hypothetical protein